MYPTTSFTSAIISTKMLLKNLLLASVVAAAPADLENRVVNCKAIDLVVKALRIAPGASKYCSSVLHVATTTVQTTSTSTTTSTK